MEKFTPETIFNQLGTEPTERKILQMAATMMRQQKTLIRKNNIFTLMYYMEIVKIAYNTGAFCNCFKTK